MYTGTEEEKSLYARYEYIACGKTNSKKKKVKNDRLERNIKHH